MKSITSLEELQALPVGTHVIEDNSALGIQRDEWVKRGDSDWEPINMNDDQKLLVSLLPDHFLRFTDEMMNHGIENMHVLEEEDMEVAA